METERKAIELNQLKTMEGAKFIRKTKTFFLEQNELASLYWENSVINKPNL
jgi:hypothetical protein